MNKSKKSRFLIFLIVTMVVGSVGSADVGAQTRDEAQKRLFAARLKRREHIAAAQAARTAEAAHAAREKVEAHQPARAVVDVTVAARRVTSSDLGVSASTPVVPAGNPVVPSGNGVGRDAYMESLYTEILGRDPSQSDLDFWTKVLARGATTDGVARTLWNSKEHRGLVRNHDAPGIPLAKVVRDANAAARQAHQKK